MTRRTRRERVTVMGNGGWGTALALVLLGNGHGDLHHPAPARPEGELRPVQVGHPLGRGVKGDIEVVLDVPRVLYAHFQYIRVSRRDHQVVVHEGDIEEV